MPLFYQDDEQGGEIQHLSLAYPAGKYSKEDLKNVIFSDEITILQSCKNLDRFFVLRRHRITNSHFNSTASRVLARDMDAEKIFMYGPVLHVHRNELELEILIEAFGPRIHPRVVEF